MEAWRRPAGWLFGLDGASVPNIPPSTEEKFALNPLPALGRLPSDLHTARTPRGSSVYALRVLHELVTGWTIRRIVNARAPMLPSCAPQRLYAIVFPKSGTIRRRQHQGLFKLNSYE